MPTLCQKRTKAPQGERNLCNKCSELHLSKGYGVCELRLKNRAPEKRRSIFLGRGARRLKSRAVVIKTAADKCVGLRRSELHLPEGYGVCELRLKNRAPEKRRSIFLGRGARRLKSRAVVIKTAADKCVGLRRSELHLKKEGSRKRDEP